MTAAMIGIFLGFILVHAATGEGQPAHPTQEETLSTAMATVVNTVPIAGPPEAIFDLVTTARWWIQWHPATRAVGGVTERPFGLGDRVHERGRIGDLDFAVTWTVVEHVRPSRVVLRTERPSAQITYTFQAHDGATVFTRELQYQVQHAATAPTKSDVLDQLMRVQSEQAVNQLKALVEKILHDEAMEIP